MLDHATPWRTEDADAAWWILDWALTPAAAELDLDLALTVRRLTRPGPPPAEAWARAWRAACQLVLLAQERCAPLPGPLEQDPLVVLAAQLLQAVPAPARPRRWPARSQRS